MYAAAAAACHFCRAMDKAEKEDRMKRAEQKRKEEENKRRCAAQQWPQLHAEMQNPATYTCQQLWVLQRVSCCCCVCRVD
jgi:hypothetical protein